MSKEDCLSELNHGTISWIEEEKMEWEEKQSESLSDQEKVDNERAEIEVDELKNQKFLNRDELKEKVIIAWGAKNKMNLNFRSQERILMKDNSKVSTILCSKKEKLGCSFYLEFRTSSEDKMYQLVSFTNVHNHVLNNYDTQHAINNEILESIRSLKNVVKSIPELTKYINEKYGLNFHRSTIYNVVMKMKEEDFGGLNEDAKKFLEMLEADSKQRNCFYAAKFEEKRLQSCCYMNKRMKLLLDHFSDVIIIDASHGTNRFNLPFLDIVVINNYGQTCLSYFSLLSNHQFSSFQWSL